MSDLLAAQVSDPSLTDDAIAQLSAGLLFAGHETTVAAIDKGVVLLATHPTQRARLPRVPRTRTWRLVTARATASELRSPE